MKTPKPEKGRHQHRKPPCYNNQITNLTTKPKQAKASSKEKLHKKLNNTSIQMDNTIIL